LGAVRLRRRRRLSSGLVGHRPRLGFLTDVLARLGDGSYAPPAKTTVREYLEHEWLPAPGTRPPPGAHGRAPERLYRALEQEGLSVSTRRQTHAVLSRALKDAVRWGGLVRSSAALADPPSIRRSRVEAWTANELGRQSDELAAERLAALLA